MSTQERRRPILSDLRDRLIHFADDATLEFSVTGLPPGRLMLTGVSERGGNEFGESICNIELILEPAEDSPKPGKTLGQLYEERRKAT